MPIIRRSFGGKAPDTVKTANHEPKKVPKVTTTTPTSKAHKKPRPRIVASVKPRLAIKVGSGLKVAKRWPWSDEKYVTVDNGVLTVRTPKECTNWPNDFRARLVRDYREPSTLIDRPAADRLASNETVYAIGKRQLMVRQIVEPLDNARNKVVVLRTEVIDVGDNKAMSLQHPDPAMRILMVYAFLRRMSFDGVSSFSVYDWQPD